MLQKYISKDGPPWRDHIKIFYPMARGEEKIYSNRTCGRFFLSSSTSCESSVTSCDILQFVVLSPKAKSVSDKLFFRFVSTMNSEKCRVGNAASEGNV